ncbi:NAD(P)-binding protein [Rhodocytophaga rosea]|uniref:NAD(P)-binding protein n=2 Tax=Rhodocytophaga rosea TaxID=2704465 RepID=A0A6C0GXI8_9BACT|nr:NAD(P)-binding protein [Rhodocytophaga rosea]
MRHARTPLLRSLQQAFKMAFAATSSQTAPVDELIEMTSESRYNRRKFLGHLGQAGLVLGAGGLLSACAKEEIIPQIEKATPGANARRGGPVIAIVGAGIAGLNCAYKLKKAGYTATIYEASKRVGGRMFTQKNLMGTGLTTELGGEFIDSGHKEMLKLTKEFGFSLIDTFAPSEQALIKDAYFFNGQHYTLKQVIDAFAPYAAKIASDIDALPSVITYNNPEKAVFYDQMSISDYFNYIGMSGWIRSLLEVAYLTEYGLEVHEQSCINFLWLFSPDTSKGSFDIFGDSDERYKIIGGNQQVTDALYKQVQNQVVLENKLVAIHPNGKGYKLAFEKTNGSITEVLCDIAVLTLPFTLLRNVAITVPLPSWKTNAIQNLGYGTNAKLLLGFNTKPWRTNGYTGYLFSKGPVQSGWDNTQLQAGNKGGYTVYLGGIAGVKVGQGTAQSQVSNFLPALQAIWPGMSSSFNGIAERMHWPTHPFTKASYACYKPGQYTTIAGAERKSVGNLFFAGEHCSINYQGYMNGAAETGKQAAEEILSSLTGKKLVVATDEVLYAEQV